MKDVGVDLRAARRRLESTSQQVPLAAAAHGPVAMYVMAGAALVVAISVAVLVLRKPAERPTESDATAKTGSNKQSVAVLYFDNTTGDKQLDWLRTGITEMVVTDLSQSQDLEVVGTDRLYEILAELKRADDKTLSPDVIREIAQRTGVDNVIVGSYMKSGDAVRINVRLQEAKTGRIVTSERVEGPNSSSLFAMVDDLSRRIRSKFESLGAGLSNAPTLLTAPGASTADGLDRGLGDVTTSSIEAYRNYTEGVNLHERYREAEAATLFEKAISIDPAFAMADIKLAVTEFNLGHQDLSDKYATSALKHSDRLTPRERFYIEGYYYTQRPATIGRGLEAYQKCIDLDAGHQACRHNLALTLTTMGRFQESASHYEELLRRGSTNPSTFSKLSGNYNSLGQPDKALAITQAFSKRNPESGAGDRGVALALIVNGRYEEALQELSRAAMLDPTDPSVLLSRAVAQTLREDWPAARETAAALSASPDETRKWNGAIVQQNISQFTGRQADGLMWADRAITAYKVPGTRSAIGHRVAATFYLSKLQAPQAIAQLQKALIDSKGLPEEVNVQAAIGVAYAMASRFKEADDAIAALAATSDPLTAATTNRTASLARGQVALVRKNYETAIAQLTAAQAALPAGSSPIAPSQHVPTWFALGEADMGANKPAEAEPWFQKIATSTYQHNFGGFEYVRSFYYLGRIYDAAGDATKSREAYRRFVGFWKDGDLDRDRVAEAERKLRGQ